MVSENWFIDLNIAKKYLGPDAGEKQLVRAITMLAAVYSAEQDLVSSRRSLDRLNELIENLPEPPDLLVIGQALMQHAVIAYCRAVVSDSDGRPKVILDKYLSPQMLEIQKEVRELRNEAFSHHGLPEGRYSKGWRYDGLFLVADNETEHLSAPHRMFVESKPLRDDLSSLIAAASLAIEEVKEKRASFFYDLIEASPDLKAKLSQFWLSGPADLLSQGFGSGRIVHRRGAVSMVIENAIK